MAPQGYVPSASVITIYSFAAAAIPLFKGRPVAAIAAVPQNASPRSRGIAGCLIRGAIVHNDNLSCQTALLENLPDFVHDMSDALLFVECGYYNADVHWRSPGYIDTTNGKCSRQALSSLQLQARIQSPCD
jgi:hypothetical protein